jgi:CheY-like chemotaxis protein
MDILIVENESSIVLDLKESLHNLGHNVVDVASTGE